MDSTDRRFVPLNMAARSGHVEVARVLVRELGMEGEGPEEVVCSGVAPSAGIQQSVTGLSPACRLDVAHRKRRSGSFTGFAWEQALLSNGVERTLWVVGMVASGRVQLAGSDWRKEFVPHS
eukprot:g8364.t1